MGDTSDDDGTNQFIEMSKDELVDYLAARGISTTGTKLALVGRAFVAWESGVPIKASTEQFQQQLKLDYEGVLTKHKIPDPRKLPSSHWCDRVTKWPLVDKGKIFMYILNSKEINKDYIGRYKNEKAYSYFKSKFVDTVLWAQVPDDPERCFLTSEVTPSQSVRGDTHKPWILLQNTGNIITAICTCTSGMCHTCNHVIAVLYKVDYAIKQHMNKESCTEKSCVWNRSTKKNIEPKTVAEMDLRADSASKDSSDENNESLRKMFDPRRQGENIKKPEEVGNFLEGLSKFAPKCALLTGMAAQLQMKQLKQMPPTIQQVAEECINKYSDLEPNILSEKFGESLVFDKNQCEVLEEKTREQGSSSLWHDHRKGRITGSNVKRVVRKVEELNRTKKAATTSLAHHLMTGGQDLSHLPAIQWGKDQEEKALHELKMIMSDEHKNLSVRRAGLYVKATLPYIGASPDAIIYCDCHGHATVEIKCPYKLKGMDIETHYKETNFLYKQETDDTDIKLREDHDYHYQVQAQLAITGFHAAYFCVSSLNGKPLILKVLRDEKFWETVEQKVVMFFKSYLSKYLLRLKEFSFCPSCDKLCLEPRECQKLSDNSVCCDLCNLWYHWTCVDYKTDQDNFICTLCAEDNMD